jgi:membrane peptidoglycan carboxypeptidase
MRRIDFPRNGRTGWRRWIPSWRQFAGLSVFSVAVLAGLFVAVYEAVDIPDVNASAREQASVYYWADGTPMVTVGAVNRQTVKLAQVPLPLQHAVIAAENADFYQDSGVSVSGIARAAVNILKGEETQGGSTITQQYVKNTYLSQDQTVTRKIKELFISLKLANQEPKSDILQGYLNTSWFGRDSYGIQAASYAYYGIPAKSLNPGQSALMASLLKGSEQYDPSLSAANHKRAVARWKWILDREVATGSMTAKERAAYTVFPEPKKAVKPSSQAGQTGYLIDIANKYVKSRSGLTDKDFARGGYRIHTTFEKDKVRALSDAVDKVRHESLDPAKRAADTYVEVGAASVRPSDGAIVAVYGGANAVEHFSDNADTAGVPAGSAFKPFVYAAALQNGLFSARRARPVPKPRGPVPGGAAAADAPVAGKPGAGVLPPAGTVGKLDLALLDGQNTPFVEAGKDVGLAKVRDLAVAAGLREESMAKLEPTFSIGTSTPSAVRMASAYTSFVNAGSHVEPYSVTRVVHGGADIPGFGEPKPRKVMDPSVAAQVGRALALVAAKTFKGPEYRQFPADGTVLAGRTGDTDRMKSAWFIGTSKELSTAVTMFRTKPGAPQLLGMQGVGGADSEHGSVFPPRIWADYTGALTPA